MRLQYRHPPGQDRTGFTLIEVLVVVAIIALLISILIPSLHKAREQTKVVICKTRLGQLYRGHSFYAADDKRGQFPHWSWWLFDGVGHGEAKASYNAPADIYAKTGGVRSPDSRVWVTYGDIFKYVKDPEVYFCPGDTKVRPQSGSIGNGRSGNGDYPIHSFPRLVDANFFIQKKIDGADVNNGQLQPGDFINPDKLRPGVFKGDSEGLPQVKNFQSIPCRVGMMYEEDQGLGDIPFTKSATLNDGHSSVVVYTDYMSARHERRGHMLYFDGHAELCSTDRWNNYPKDKYVLYRVLGAGNFAPPKP